MIIVIVLGGKNLTWRNRGRVYYVEESDDGEKDSEECIMIESETEEELVEIIKRKEKEIKEKDQQLQEKDEEIAELTEEVKTLNITIGQQENYMQVMKAEYDSVVEECKRGE